MPSDGSVARATAPALARRVARLLPARSVRFLAVGGLAALIELGAFLALRALHVPLVAANVVSFLAGLVVSFAGNRRWSFSGDHVHSGSRQFVAYATLAAFNAAATSLALGAAVRAGIPEPVAKLVCMAMVATWNFFIFDRVIFRRR